MKVDTLVLTPEAEAPSRHHRWCPRCREWKDWPHNGARCDRCRTAQIRPAKIVKSKAGELRPGVVAEFADPRDRYNPTRELETLRARLRAK